MGGHLQGDACLFDEEGVRWVTCSRSWVRRRIIWWLFSAGRGRRASWWARGLGEGLVGMERRGFGGRVGGKGMPEAPRVPEASGASRGHTGVCSFAAGVRLSGSVKRRAHQA